MLLAGADNRGQERPPNNMAIVRKSLTVILLAGLPIGAALGLGGYTFAYAQGGSYLGNDARACANCHIMNAQYDGWVKSSHRNVAQCNDCHAPHNFFGKYLTKAVNGFKHSWAFTTGRFPEPILISERDREITEGACRSCHAELVRSIDHASTSPVTGAVRGAAGKELACTGCHHDVGHAH